MTSEIARMTPNDEPKTDAELMTRLRALYIASDHSGGALDDFWDTVSFHIGWIIDLAERGARKKANTGKANGGHARAAALSPERRKQIAQQAARARWGES